MSNHIIAGRQGAMPIGYTPREREAKTVFTPAAPVDREVRAQTIAEAASRAAEKKDAMPPKPKVRAVAVMPPKPPKAPPRSVLHADVFAVLPDTPQAAMSRSELAAVMGLTGIEIERLGKALTRMERNGSAKARDSGIRRAHLYYRGRATLDVESETDKARLQAILDVLPTAERHGIPAEEVAKRVSDQLGETVTARELKWSFERLLRDGLIGPRGSIGSGRQRKYYRIVEEEQEMNAPIIDPVIATLAHDPDIGQPPIAQRDVPVVAFESLDDSDIADAVAALADDTNARDLRDDSIEAEALAAEPPDLEWASVALLDLTDELRQQQRRINCELKTISGVSQATMGLTVMEAVDLLEWLTERLIKAHEQKQANHDAG